ncbi:MAG: complex I NDUFA9 subunit family protein [Nitrospirae bacterium]|nr:complex I NDUFA9 subunit family protein [Nitrospirota bacterium]
MIFIAGASGFVGGHLVDDLISKGHKLKCLARSEKAGTYLSGKGVKVIRGDITAPETLSGALHPGDFVIHLVGILEEKGKATFQSIHVEGTANLLEEAKRAGVRHFFYQSALGADINSWSGYLKTKAGAEELVRQSGLSYTIFRPSLIIGPWDGFTKKIVEMLRLSPVLPIPGEGKARFQPVYIKDWLKCMNAVIGNPEGFAGTYEIGGPEHLSYKEIVETLSRSLGHSRPSFTIPMGLMKLGASLFEKILPSPPVTSDQLRLLEQDNITNPDAVEKYFAFKPLRYEDALREFIK